MKATTLEDYYQQAIKRLPQRSAVMMVELIEEIRRLRTLYTKRKARRGEDLDDECEISFGEYEGERLADVPDDYLIWWRDQNRVDILRVDATFAPQPMKSIAQAKLRLWEYICKRVRTETKDIEQAIKTALESNERGIIEGSETKVVEDTTRETGETSANA